MLKFYEVRKPAFAKMPQCQVMREWKIWFINHPQQQSVPDIQTDLFDEKPLEFNYFMSLFEELVEGKIEDQKGRVTRLIKFKTGEAKEAVSIASDKQRSCTKMWKLWREESILILTISLQHTGNIRRSCLD